MSEQTWSWIKALEEGTLTEMQRETLQALVDDEEALTLLEAARLLDFEATHKVGEEPGTYAF
jgi:hypothetical protein